MTLVEWLQSCNCTAIFPIKVTIGKKTYEGAEYVQHGSRHLYLLGELPVHRKKTVYQLEGGEWYIGSYWQSYELNPYAPLGRSFMLFRWPHKELIDYYDNHKSDRLPITLEYHDGVDR